MKRLNVRYQTSAHSTIEVGPLDNIVLHNNIYNQVFLQPKFLLLRVVLHHDTDTQLT